MASSAERMRILKMIEDKQITAEDGARLLAALGSGSTEPTQRETAGRARWLRVRVTDQSTGKVKVNITVPAGLINVGAKLGARFAPDMAGMDLTTIQAAIREGVQGKVMEVEDAEDNERVEIFVE